jgi:hypothetical protein
MSVSVWLYRRAMNLKTESGETWRRKFAGESINNAYVALDEIEEAQIN